MEASSYFVEDLATPWEEAILTLEQDHPFHLVVEA